MQFPLLFTLVVAAPLITNGPTAGEPESRQHERCEVIEKNRDQEGVDEKNNFRPTKKCDKLKNNRKKNRQVEGRTEARENPDGDQTREKKREAKRKKHAAKHAASKRYARAMWGLKLTEEQRLKMKDIFSTAHKEVKAAVKTFRQAKADGQAIDRDAHRHTIDVIRQNAMQKVYNTVLNDKQKAKIDERRKKRQAQRVERAKDQKDLQKRSKRKEQKSKKQSKKTRRAKPKSDQPQPANRASD